METPREYYYTYYSYEEWGMGYFGSRGCNCLPEEDVKYFGSFRDKYFKPTQKIILKDDYNTREEAYMDEIILHDYYDVANNPHFANKAKQTSTKFSFSSIEHSRKIGNDNVKLKRGFCGLTKEKRTQISRNSGLKHKENKTGFFKMSKEEKSELGKKNALKNKKNKMGIFKMTSDELSKCGSKGGSKTFELKKGAFSLSKESRKEIAKKSGNKVKELGLGIFALTDEEKTEIGKKGYEGGLGKMNKEQRSKIALKVNSQKWKCLITGHISNAGGLSRFQNKRNIDRSMRVML
jgi:general stress protein YciG